MADEAFTKADIDKAVADAVAKAEEGLKAKRDELMDEVKNLRQQLRSTQEIKPEDLTAAEQRADKAEQALAEAQKQVKTLTGERDKLAKQVEAESGFTSKLLTENALNDALAAAGVKEAPMLKAVKAMFGPLAQVAVEGDQRMVKVGDKALADYVKDWAATDEAKHFISAPANNGGGAPGGSGSGGGAKTMTREEYNQKIVSDPAGMRDFIKDGGKIVNAAA